MIEGLDSLLDKLERIPNALDDAMTVWLPKALETVRAAQVGLATVASGELKTSIHSQLLPAGRVAAGKTYTNVEHAVYNEFGTGERGAASPNDNPNVSPSHTPGWPGMSAQPFMYPGYKQAEKKIRKDAVTAARRVLRGTGK